LNQLIHIEAARQELEVAKTVEEVKDLRDPSERI
jgi:hypothetical protein